MKKSLLSLLFLGTYAILNAQISDAQSGATRTVTTGASYANEVFYHFDNGSVKTVARNTWDIAFITDQMEISILANNGNGINVYTYPDGSIANWDETLDITNVSTWPKMYNSYATWFVGALVTNAIPGDQLDYGWGTYNTGNHTISGDSIFIVKLSDATYRKLAIVQKNAVENTWTFKYANLDGTNEQQVNFDADDYSSFNFIHYSILNQAIVEQEAPATDWQLLFTKYYDTSIPYNVAGVLTSPNVSVQEVRQSNLDQSTFTAYNDQAFTDVINTIGSDWKSYNMETSAYDLIDTVVYFVQVENGDVWKMYFTGFGGMSTGTFTFNQENLTQTSVPSVNGLFTTVYPNPSTERVSCIFDMSGDVTLNVYQLNGALVYQSQMSAQEKLNQAVIEVSQWPAGMYQIVLSNGNETSTSKFVKL